MAFVLVIGAYFYLQDAQRDLAAERAAARPEWGTAQTFVLLASAVPNELAKKAASG